MKTLKITPKTSFKFDDSQLLEYNQNDNKSDTTFNTKIEKIKQMKPLSFVDFNSKTSSLFIENSQYSIIKQLFQNPSTQPIIIYGLPCSGKFSNILQLLQYLPYFDSGREPDNKFNHLKFFNRYQDEDYQKILYYQNCYYLDMKLFLNSENGIPNQFLLKKLGNQKSLDGTFKIIIFRNIDLMTKNNQKQLANILERYQSSALFIMTTNKLLTLEQKIKSLYLGDSPNYNILKDDLNKVGLFKVEINFHSEVKANISIKIDKIQSK